MTRLIVAAGIMTLLVLAVVFLRGTVEDKDSSPSQVPVEARYDTKIVYTTEIPAETEALRAHCREMGGVFHECGSICAPDEEICVEVCAYTCEEIPAQEGPAFDTGAWSTFPIQGYGARIRYPAEDWSTEADTSFSLSPKFNIYRKPPGVPLDLPLDHFANVSHLSIYPRGIPTEGLFGQTRPFDLELPFAISAESRLHLLEDGTPFAGLIKPSHPPEGWGDAGFVWMRVRMEDLEVRCLRDGEEVGMEVCDPMADGDRIVRSGTVDPDLWTEELAILRTLRFDPGLDSGESDGMVRLIQPEAGDTVSSPLTVHGQARGPWYFEGTFPVVLTDWDGRIIAETRAESKGEWTTGALVPFRATLQFVSPFTRGDPEHMGWGTLILRKANPSGLPENDAAREIRIRFAG